MSASDVAGGWPGAAVGAGVACAGAGDAGAGDDAVGVAGEGVAGLDGAGCVWENAAGTAGIVSRRAAMAHATRTGRVVRIIFGIRYSR